MEQDKVRRIRLGSIANPGRGGPSTIPSLAFVFHARQPSVRVPPKSQHLVMSLPVARYDKSKNLSLDPIARTMDDPINQLYSNYISLV